MSKFRKVIFASAVSIGSLALVSAASAQEYNDTLGGFTGSSTTDVGDPVITQTGDASVDPYQNTITSEQTQTVTSTGAGGQGVVANVGGINYFGFMTVSGEGSQNQIVTETQVNQYDPLDVLAPPTVVSTSTTTAPDGDPTVTAVSASGFVGAQPRYSSTLTSGDVITDNSVVATENSSLLNSAGITFEQRVGTATYNPTDGTVTVDLPTAATSSTSISATGISTTGAISSASLSTGAISATSLDMNGGRITGLGAGVAATDAVNLGQLNAAVTTINGQITSLSSLVEANRKRSDAGIATAVALSGGTFLPNKRFNLTANLGGYRDEVAVSAQVGILVSENVAINAGVATALHSYGGTSYRGGVTFGF